MAKATQAYHYATCASQAVSDELMGKVRRGGMGANGPILARRAVAVERLHCDLCSEPIKVGETMLLVTVDLERANG